MFLSHSLSEIDHTRSISWVLVFEFSKRYGISHLEQIFKRIFLRPMSLTKKEKSMMFPKQQPKVILNEEVTPYSSLVAYLQSLPCIYEEIYTLLGLMAKSKDHDKISANAENIRRRIHEIRIEVCRQDFIPFQLDRGERTKLLAAVPESLLRFDDKKLEKQICGYFTWMNKERAQENGAIVFQKGATLDRVPVRDWLANEILKHLPSKSVGIGYNDDEGKLRICVLEKGQPLGIAELTTFLSSDNARRQQWSRTEDERFRNLCHTDPKSVEYFHLSDFHSRFFSYRQPQLEDSIRTSNLHSNICILNIRNGCAVHFEREAYPANGYVLWKSIRAASLKHGEHPLNRLNEEIQLLLKSLQRFRSTHFNNVDSDRKVFASLEMPTDLPQDAQHERARSLSALCTMFPSSYIRETLARIFEKARIAIRIEEPTCDKLGMPQEMISCLLTDSAGIGSARRCSDITKRWDRFEEYGTTLYYLLHKLPQEELSRALSGLAVPVFILGARDFVGGGAYPGINYANFMRLVERISHNGPITMDMVKIMANPDLLISKGKLDADELLAASEESPGLGLEGHPAFESMIRQIDYTKLLAWAYDGFRTESCGAERVFNEVVQTFSVRNIASEILTIRREWGARQVEPFKGFGTDSNTTQEIYNKLVIFLDQNPRNPASTISDVLKLFLESVTGPFTLRQDIISYFKRNPAEGTRNTTVLAPGEIENRYATLCQSIGKNSLTEGARKWWGKVEEALEKVPAERLRVAEEISRRGATIQDFFWSFIDSGTTNTQANLHFLDYRLSSRTDVAEGPGNVKPVFPASATAEPGKARQEIIDLIGEQQTFDSGDPEARFRALEKQLPPTESAASTQSWESFCLKFASYPEIRIWLVKELLKRSVSIGDFCRAAISSNTDHPVSALHYLDYMRLKNE